MMRQQAVGVCVCAALCARCSALGPSPAGVARAAPRVGIIVVDHGSKRAEANDALGLSHEGSLVRQVDVLMNMLELSI